MRTSTSSSEEPACLSSKAQVTLPCTLYTQEEADFCLSMLCLQGGTAQSQSLSTSFPCFLNALQIPNARPDCRQSSQKLEHSKGNCQSGWCDSERGWECWCVNFRLENELSHGFLRNGRDWDLSPQTLQSAPCLWAA